jgi:hypothetical protein
MHLGSGSSSGRAIHWHANPAIRVEYVSTDEGETIPYVKVIDADGRVKEYVTSDATEQIIREGTRRTMESGAAISADCEYCHKQIEAPS